MVYNSFLMNDHRFVIPLQIWICQRQWIEMGSSPAPKKLSKTRVFRVVTDMPYVQVNHSFFSAQVGAWTTKTQDKFWSNDVYDVFVVVVKGKQLITTLFD